MIVKYQCQSNYSYKDYSKEQFNDGIKSKKKYFLKKFYVYTPLLDALKVFFELRFVRSSELIPGMYVETKYDFGKIPAVPTLK